MIHLSRVARSQHFKFINTHVRTHIHTQEELHKSAGGLTLSSTGMHTCKKLTPNLSSSPTSHPLSNLWAVKQSVKEWALVPTLPVVLYLPLTISRVTQLKKGTKKRMEEGESAGTGDVNVLKNQNPSKQRQGGSICMTFKLWKAHVNVFIRLLRDGVCGEVGGGLQCALLDKLAAKNYLADVTWGFPHLHIHT